LHYLLQALEDVAEYERHRRIDKAYFTLDKENKRLFEILSENAENGVANVGFACQLIVVTCDPCAP
jgi:hypothetical protein